MCTMAPTSDFSAFLSAFLLPFLPFFRFAFACCGLLEFVSARASRCGGVASVGAAAAAAAASSPALAPPPSAEEAQQQLEEAQQQLEQLLSVDEAEQSGEQAEVPMHRVASLARLAGWSLGPVQARTAR